MRSISLSLAGLLVVAALPCAAAGQTVERRQSADGQSPLVTGTRVRITHRGERQWTGVLVGRNADTLVVREPSGADTNVVPLAQVTRLEVSRGPGQRHVVRNTVIGLAVGTGMGLFVGSALSSGGCSRYDPCWLDITGKYPEPPRHDRAMIGAIVGGAAGGVLGYLVGHRPSEKWQTLSLHSQRARISASPRDGGSLAVALAF